MVERMLKDVDSKDGVIGAAKTVDFCLANKMSKISKLKVCCR